MITFCKEVIRQHYHVFIFALCLMLWPQIQKIISNNPSSDQDTGNGIADKQLNANAVNKLFTSEELLTYTGDSGSPGLYLSILGSVYDVEKGRKHYETGSTYNIFIGKDASKSFITGDFENQSDDPSNDDVLTLEPRELLSLTEWKTFYDREYPFKGYLIGRFYDESGKETKYFEEVNVKVELAIALRKRDEELKDLYPPCNIEWKSETGTRVWCTTQSGGIERGWVGVPRKYFEPGKSDYRCACIHSDKLQLNNNNNNNNLKEYDDCDPNSTSCVYFVDDSR